MRKFEIQEESQGWRVWDAVRGVYISDDHGMFRYEKTCRAAIVMLQEHLGTFCPICEEKLRQSEGDGPCSDCHDTQCSEKDKEEAPAPA